MSKRRTYRETRKYSARVMAFRKSVYEGRRLVTPMCQVLLLRLSDDMREDCKVSVPRNQLAAEFDVPYQRITEWVRQARKVGFLDLVEAGRPGTATTYQGLIVRVERAREDVPTKGTPARAYEGHESTDPSRARQAVPKGHAYTPTHEVVTTTSNPFALPEVDQFQHGHDDERGIEEELACDVHDLGFCPLSCDNHPANSRRLA